MQDAQHTWVQYPPKAVVLRQRFDCLSCPAANKNNRIQSDKPAMAKDTEIKVRQFPDQFGQKMLERMYRKTDIAEFVIDKLRKNSTAKNIDNLHR